MAGFGADDAGLLDDLRHDVVGDVVHVRWTTSSSARSWLEIEGHGTEAVGIGDGHRVTLRLPEGGLRYRVHVRDAQGGSITTAWCRVP